MQRPKKTPVTFTSDNAGGYGAGPTQHDPSLLFNLEHDPSEQYDVAADNPQVITEIKRIVNCTGKISNPLNRS